MDEAPWYVMLIISWLPFLVLIGTAIWVARTIRAGSQTKDGRSLAQVLDDHARELRRSNDLFEQAIKSQQRRLEVLEQKP
jgi:Flp pilus assembly protein TadB